MAFELENFRDENLDADYLDFLVDQQSPDTLAQFGRFWDYLRNPISHGQAERDNTCARPYTQAQEEGLPPRITGAGDGPRKEVVIENDIAWRIHTMVDYLFGAAPTIRSLCPDKALAHAIEQTVAALLDASGGTAFLQEVALLGSVYGYVDIALRTPADGAAPAWDTAMHTPWVQAVGLKAAAPDDSAPTAQQPSAPAAAGHQPGTPIPLSLEGRGWPKGPGEGASPHSAISAVRGLLLEAIEAPRIVPVLDAADGRRARVWVQRFTAYPPRMSGGRGLLARLGLAWGSLSPAAVEVVEIIGPRWWQRYEDRRLVAQGPNPLGRLSIVHIQNLALAGSYAGLSDVEPLMALQDELNTRLSDRAQRVTYQSFKMYLGKGIDDFLERPVAPGQMWATQNLSASIEEFGSDPGSPSEDAHIAEVRAALDKVSGVTPLAAGLIHGNIGNLTSATALRVLLAGLLARTARKRLTYGAGIEQLVELVLEHLDRIGVLKTTPADRKVEIHWPSLLPTDEGEQLRNAQIKAQLGVPLERIQAELGYTKEEITDC